MSETLGLAALSTVQAIILAYLAYMTAKLHQELKNRPPTPGDDVDG